MNAPGKLHSPTIDNARRQARIQSNRTGISLNQALDAQAVSMGFRHWHEAVSVAQRNPGDARLMAQIDLGSFLEFKADFVRRLFEPQRESAERLNRLWERQNLPKNQDVLQSRGFLTAEQAQGWMNGHEERHPGAGKSLANRWSSISIFSSQDVPGKNDLHFFADTSFLQWGDKLGRVAIGSRTFMGGNFTTPSFAARRPGLENGVVRNLKDLELVYFKDSTLIESIDELAMMAMKGGDLDDADRAAISRMRSAIPAAVKSVEPRRFSVREKVGYDAGSGVRDFGLIGEADTLDEARAIRDKHTARIKGGNTAAAYAYAEIEDRLDEHAIVGYGEYGDGSRITSVRPVIALSKDDDVLFRGSRQECLKHQESDCSEWTGFETEEAAKAYLVDTYGSAPEEAEASRPGMAG